MSCQTRQPLWSAVSRVQSQQLCVTVSVGLGARVAGLSRNQYGVSKSKAGQLVRLVCSKRGNLVYLGTKFVTASGGCTCVSDPRVGGSCDQCGVSRSHEIMSTVAFLYRWEEKCAWFCFLSCCPEVWWFTQSGIICVSARGTSGPQRTESGGLARDLRGSLVCQAGASGRKTCRFPVCPPEDKCGPSAWTWPPLTLTSAEPLPQLSLHSEF